MRKTVFAFILICGLALLCPPQALANVTVTAATGGTNISADKAQNASAPAFTTLGNIVISENANGDFALGTGITLILTAPAGWRFNSPGSVTTTVSASGTPDVVVNSVTVTASTITLNLTVIDNKRGDTLTIIGVQVQAIDGAALPSAGNILRTSGNPGTAVIAGITNNVTSFGSLSQVVGAAKTLVVAGFPSPTTAGVTNTFTVTAKDQFSNIATGYVGTVHFTSSDGQAVLPGNTGLTNGTGAFSAALKIAGTQSITATDTITSSITGTQPNIVVNAAVATKLVFTTQPANTTAGVTMASVVVQIQDQFGNNVSNAGTNISLTLNGGGTLSGTTTLTTDATGKATFDDLSITQSGSGKSLKVALPVASVVSVVVPLNVPPPFKVSEMFVPALETLFPN